MAPTIFLFVTGAHRICGSLNEVPSDPWTLPPTRAKPRLSTAGENPESRKRTEDNGLRQRGDRQWRRWHAKAP
ncbi:uncharacterized protein PG986_013969 [Apiospora aurea]|uniref:Uncharacterized protein n=1 Tax=Apiospora aurea TaxID=335848 RepID=A0ABR1PX25_9PEZI